jgi:hypothetical protein
MPSRSDAGHPVRRAGREFPTLGSKEQHRVSPGTRTRFFVTGPFARTESWSSAALIGLVHAKELGTNATACGLQTGSWATRWDVAFVSGRLLGACARCREVVDVGH